MEPFITSYTSNCDGGGSCVHRFMSGYAIGKRMGVQYKHIIQRIWEHNRGDLENEEWSLRWNRLIPFPEAPLCDLLPSNTGTIDEIRNGLSLNRSVNILWPKYIIDRDITIMEDVKEDLQELFKRNPYYSAGSYDLKRINIALHVRAFTDTDTCDIPIRRLFGMNAEYDNYFFDSIVSLKQQLGGLPITFHIYSEGNIERFAKFLEYQEGDCKVSLHINEPVLTSIYDMVSADLFIASVSSLSYIVHVLAKCVTIAFVAQFHNWLPSCVRIEYGTELLVKSKAAQSALEMYRQRK